MDRRLSALLAMANQDDSPNERDIARTKLEAMGMWPPPPRPPAPSTAAPAPDDPLPWVFGSSTTATSGTFQVGGSTYSFRVELRR